MSDSQSNPAEDASDTPEEPEQIDFGLDAIKNVPVDLPKEFRAEVEAKRAAKAAQMSRSENAKGNRLIFSAVFGGVCGLVCSFIMVDSGWVHRAGMLIGGAILGSVVDRKRLSSTAAVVAYGFPLILFSIGCMVAHAIAYDVMRFFFGMLLLPISGGLSALFRETEELDDSPF